MFSARPYTYRWRNCTAVWPVMCITAYSDWGKMLTFTYGNKSQYNSQCIDNIQMVHEILQIGLIDRRLMGKIEKIMQEKSYDGDWWRLAYCKELWLEAGEKEGSKSSLIVRGVSPSTVRSRTPTLFLLTGLVLHNLKSEIPHSTIIMIFFIKFISKFWSFIKQFCPLQ